MGFSREKFKLIIAIPVFISIIGLFLILKSTTLGNAAANNYLAKLGSMDTSKFLILVENYIAGFRIIGAIFLGLGSYFSLKYILKNLE